MAVAHYLEALDFQKEIVKIQTIFGGKNPHPNWLVGGVPCPINVDDVGAVGALNLERLNMVGNIVDHRPSSSSIRSTFPISSPSPRTTRTGPRSAAGSRARACSRTATFPTGRTTTRADCYRRGAIINGNLKEVSRRRPARSRGDPGVRDALLVQVRRREEGAASLGRARPTPNFVLGKNTKGTKTDIKELDESAKYSFIKAPRWKGHAMEVGPLARYIVAYAKGVPEIKEQVDRTLKQLDVPLPALFSTLGRTAARGLECQWAVHKMKYFYDGLMSNVKNNNVDTANVSKWEPSTWPKEAKGVGIMEAPRGALAHWIRIKDHEDRLVPVRGADDMERQPARCRQGKIGAYEAALMNTKMAKPEWPLEILRTIHSFDPCLACATHVMSPEGKELVSVKVK